MTRVEQGEGVDDDVDGRSARVAVQIRGRNGRSTSVEVQIRVVRTCFQLINRDRQVVYFLVRLFAGFPLVGDAVGMSVAVVWCGFDVAGERYICKSGWCGLDVW